MLCNIVSLKIHCCKSGDLSSKHSNDQIILNWTLDTYGEEWGKLTMISPFLEIVLVYKSRWAPQAILLPYHSWFEKGGQKQIIYESNEVVASGPLIA